MEAKTQERTKEEKEEEEASETMKASTNPLGVEAKVIGDKAPTYTARGFDTPLMTRTEPEAKVNERRSK